MLETLIIGVGGMTNGGKSTLSRSLHQQITNSCIIAQDSYFKDESIIPVDSNGFLQYDSYCEASAPPLYHRCTMGSGSYRLTVGSRKPLNELFDKRYFLEIPYEVCKRRRSLRVYTPLDPPGYFDGHVWPMYLKNRQAMERVVSGITFLDGLKPKEELLVAVYEDVSQAVERLRGKR